MNPKPVKKIDRLAIHIEVARLAKLWWFGGPFNKENLIFGTPGAPPGPPRETREPPEVPERYVVRCLNGVLVNGGLVGCLGAVIAYFSSLIDLAWFQGYISKQKTMKIQVFPGGGPPGGDPGGSLGGDPPGGPEGGSPRRDPNFRSTKLH